MVATHLLGSNVGQWRQQSLLARDLTPTALGHSRLRPNHRRHVPQAADVTADLLASGDESPLNDGASSNGAAAPPSWKSMLTSVHDKEIFALALPALFRWVLV
jgi:hypothetical protein